MYIIIFVVGTILGSFYLVLATRLPKNEDIITSRSKCDFCKHKLNWYNLIPLFSYIIQKGKCTFCGKKINSLHFIVELGTGFLFLFSYLLFGISYEFYIGLIISSLLIIIFVSDFKYMIILDSPLIISCVLVIILKYIYFGINNIIISILSGIALLLVMYLVMIIGNKIFKKESLGGGDIKLSFVIGLILNFQLGLVALILSTFLALPYAIATLYLNKSNEFPFGPFLIGALLIVFYNLDKFDLLLKFLSIR